MTAEVAVAMAGQTVADAARLMRDLNVGFIPVCQADGSVLGTVTDRDLVLQVMAGQRSYDTRLDEVMSTDIVACQPADDARRAEDLMRQNQVDRVLVIDEAGVVAGIVSLSDVAQFEDDERRLGRLTADILERETRIPH